MDSTFYLEAEVDSYHQGSLRDAADELQGVFSDGYIEHLKLNNDLCASEIYAQCFPRYVKSIKAVQYTASNNDTQFHETQNCRIVVNVYKMRDNDAIDLGDDLSSTQPRALPTTELHGAWDSLVFDSDIKESLIQLATNSLRLKQLNRLILLTGPPGTGKSTLAQALAQKLSIRLNRDFSETILLHIRAAALLSHYFGQSSKHIHNLFQSVADLSSRNPATFYVLIIDEIESLAGSRSRANAQAEVHDAIRATNELLLGFDTIKNRRNVLIICTSNLPDSIDEAFKGRCSKIIVVPPPGAPARYAILRLGLQALVDDELIHITEHDALPSYKNAVPDLESDYGNTGMSLRKLVDSLDKSSSGEIVSARWLGQLPVVALGTYLQPKATCALNEAVEMMVLYVESLGIVTQKTIAGNLGGSQDNSLETALGHKQKRNLDQHPADRVDPKRPRVEPSVAIDELNREVMKRAIEEQLGPTIERLEKKITEIEEQLGPTIERLEKKITEFEKELLVLTERPPLFNATDKGLHDVEIDPSHNVRAAEKLRDLRLSSRRIGQGGRRPLGDIVQPSSDAMLLDDDASMSVEKKKKHRVGSLVDKLDSVLDGVAAQAGAP